MTDWTEKEAAKLRRKISGWVDANMRRDPMFRAKGPGEYAEAMGVSDDMAKRLCKAHEARLKAFGDEEAGEAGEDEGRRVVVAFRPGVADRPRQWDRDALRIKGRVMAEAHKVCYAEKGWDKDRWRWR